MLANLFGVTRHKRLTIVRAAAPVRFLANKIRAQWDTALCSVSRIKPAALCFARRKKFRLRRETAHFTAMRSSFYHFIDFQITSHRFPQTLNADRGQLPQRLPELVSPGCFARLRGAPSELSRRTTQVAFPSLDPVRLLSRASPTLMSHRSVPPAHVSGRAHLAARVRLRAIWRARSSIICGVTVPSPCVPRMIFPFCASSISVYTIRVG